MTAATAQYVTPPQYASEIVVDPSKVIGWIKRGELRAINVATDVSGRPRFRISRDAICEFESRRSARQPAKTVRRRRKKQASDFVEYF